MNEDGIENDWVNSYSIVDGSLKNTTGSKIPSEPSYLIFNTAVSSTWGFPYNPPPECRRCYDCNDPTCACVLPVGFCDMLKNETNFLINYVRVYQSPNPNAHEGMNHSIGCDTIDYPSKGYIKGNEYLYMRPDPFGMNDAHPLKSIQLGGASCTTDVDCGGTSRGICTSTPQSSKRLFKGSEENKQCQCKAGYVGPKCLSIDKYDDFPGAYAIQSNSRLFRQISNFFIPRTMIFLACILFGLFVGALGYQIRNRKITGGAYTGIAPATPKAMRRPQFLASGQAITKEERKRLLIITGTSV